MGAETGVEVELNFTCVMGLYAVKLLVTVLGYLLTVRIGALQWQHLKK